METRITGQHTTRYDCQMEEQQDRAQYKNMPAEGTHTLSIPEWACTVMEGQHKQPSRVSKVLKWMKECPELLTTFLPLQSFTRSKKRTSIKLRKCCQRHWFIGCLKKKKIKKIFNSWSSRIKEKVLTITKQLPWWNYQTSVTPVAAKWIQFEV